MRRAFALALVALLLIIGGWRLHSTRADRAAARSRIPTAEITRGPLAITLPITGTLESAEETPVRGEIAGVLVDICQDNSPVQPGDFIFQLDTEDLTAQREDRAGSLADAEEGLSSTQADMLTRIAQAESDALTARESLDLAQESAQAEREKMAAQVAYTQGELARAEQELKRYQRLAELNYIPGTRLRQVEKDYRGKQFDLDQQRAQEAEVEQRTAEQVQDQETSLALALHSLDTAKADAQAEVEGDRIHVAEAERRLAEVEAKIAQCRVAAPTAGLAVIQTNSNNWPERRPYRLGDEVESGASPVTIYDLTRMQARCQIGEMDISRVHQGQEAFVVSDKGGKRYRGKLALVEELAQESNVWQGGTPGKKVFGVLVTLEETDPARLRPGMTVDLEVVLDRLPEATLAPIRAVFTENGKAVVYRARGGAAAGQAGRTNGAQAFERVPVTIGARNDLFVEVRSGVSAGDRVALERPPAPGAGNGEARS